MKPSGCDGTSAASALMTRRRNLSQRQSGSGKKVKVFLHTKNPSLCEVNVIVGITKAGPEKQRLYKDEQCMDGNKLLTKYSFNSNTANAQPSATQGLAFRNSD